MASIQFTPSLIAFLTGVGFSFAWVVILAVALAAGRIYCSTICPLGLLQDVLHRLARFARPGPPRPAPCARPRPVLRWSFFWAAIAACALGAGTAAFVWLDPYSIFGRVAASLFRPLLVSVNNLAAAILHSGALFRVEPGWDLFSALTSAAMLLILAVLVYRVGRLYCNTVCPVGTILGWLAARAAFRLHIDPAACGKCANCLRVCKAHCIDLRARQIDMSRCVACFDCIDSCDQHAIGFHNAWRDPAQPKFVDAPSPLPQTVPDLPRRVFLLQGVAGLAGAAALGHSRTPAPAPVSPPGSSGLDAFLERCTACHLCLAACPTGVLRPSFLEYGWTGLLKPHLAYPGAFCNFDCCRCGQVCPNGAILPLDPSVKHFVKIGEAAFHHDLCVVVTNHTDCAACSEHCPTKAITTVPYGNDLRIPSLDVSLCIGCGACQYACPVKPDKAITVAGLYRHTFARKKVEARATLSKPAADFPF